MSGLAAAWNLARKGGGTQVRPGTSHISAGID